MELKGWATRLTRQNDCVGTDAFVRPPSEASVRTIPVAVEERRFSAAMRQEKIRASAPQGCVPVNAGWERFRFGIEWREPSAQNPKLPAVPHPPFVKCAKILP